MKKLLALVLYAIMISAPMVAAREAGKIPDVLYVFGSQKAGRPPIWVASEKVLTPAGTVDPTLFSLADRHSIAQTLTSPTKGDCISAFDQVAIETVVEGSNLRLDLADAVRDSGWVFTARVTARASGFSGPFPGTLLQVMPENVLKGPQDRLGKHYIFMPVGRVRIGNTELCATSQRYANLPEIGERVLLLVDLVYVNQGDFLLTGNETGIITLHQDNKVSLAERYRNSDKALTSGTAGDLLRFVQQTLQEEN